MRIAGYAVCVCCQISSRSGRLFWTGGNQDSDSSGVVKQTYSGSILTSMVVLRTEVLELNFWENGKLPGFCCASCSRLFVRNIQLDLLPNRLPLSAEVK